MPNNSTDATNAGYEASDEWDDEEESLSSKELVSMMWVFFEEVMTAIFGKRKQVDATNPCCIFLEDRQNVPPVSSLHLVWKPVG